MEGQGESKEKGSTHCLIEEEYTIAVPMVRPKAAFLELLKQAGATHEVFTRKEILRYLKVYIISKQMFDFENPSIVHCEGDLLGEVFGVPQFTINDVLNLLAENCIQLPDTHLQRKVHLVSKPCINSSTVPTSSSNLDCQATPQTSSSVITSTSSQNSQSRQLNLPRTKSRESSLSSSSGDEVDSAENATCKNPVNGTTDKNAKKADECLLLHAKRHIHSQGNTGEMSHDQIIELEDQNKESTDESSVSPSRRKRKNTNSPGEASGRKPLPVPTAGEPSRKCGTSLSITCGDDSDKDGYPWYFQGDLGDGSDNERSEIISVQGKETVIVQDSSDDLWFLEEDSTAVEVPSDTEFSIEYDIESDIPSPVESDLSSVRSGESFLVVCKESDVEFFADCSDSGNDGDKELTEADSWTCTECNQSNPPVQRYCGRCWKLRTDWLCSQHGSDDRHIDKFDRVTSMKEKDKSLCKSASEICEEGVTTLNDTLMKELAEPRYSFSNMQLKQSESSCNANDKESASAIVTKPPSVALEDPCIICLTRSKMASLIHGSSGHQVCCLSCGKDLKRRGKLCPVCRRPIQKVVRNYIL
ncbi:E3 ubiquitin-protein ligase Mdm2-like [Mercenaria mercenaria]|uniref:E3 ubiquitin-protein ligase Mdm2-like n=1 Tax=Mercenaria mercenaria TaxID=6596 RepID=UPI00234E7DDD|nr:E3 ubiquitin-protein ligase Mdm2-like [Mercenaria mercenaria]